MDGLTFRRDGNLNLSLHIGAMLQEDSIGRRDIVHLEIASLLH